MDKKNTLVNILKDVVEGVAVGCIAVQEISFIKVSFPVIGFHHWEGATGKREYLKHSHRHRFIFTVVIEVFENDREIEFHDFLEFCKNEVLSIRSMENPSGEPVNFGGKSCEQIAKDLAERIEQNYGNCRDLMVEVSEDGETSAIYSIQYNKLENGGK